MPKKDSGRKRADSEEAAFQTMPAARQEGIPQSTPLLHNWPLLLLIPAFFLMLCFTTISTIKPVALVLMLAAAAAVFLRLRVVCERINLLFAAVSLWVIVCGVSTFYAIAGKFALKEFLKLAIAYSVFLIFIAFAKKGANCGRWIAILLETSAALAGLISIDLLSTRYLGTPFLELMGRFTPDYVNLIPLSPGNRMNSILYNPNIFAGFAGIGVMISLGMANTTRKVSARCYHLVCLYLSALSFVLAFSMGGSGTIAVAFLIFLLLERKDRRISLLILMVETLLLTLFATFPIFLTSFKAWDGVQPIPLACAVGGSALLCLLDCLPGRRLATLLNRHTKAVAIAIVGVLAVAGIYAALALNITGGVTLQSSTFIRAVSAVPGEYTLQTENPEGISVAVWCRTSEQVVMNTGTTLYSGPLAEAAFTVPEDSQIVFFSLRAADEPVWMESLSYVGADGEHPVKLGYKLLPGFVANRIQDLTANANLTERFAFMVDGLKLFRRSPVIGLGMGAFESALGSVQTFRYETKYVHNHYVQMLVETGIIGLIIFLAVLVIALVGILKCRRRENASPLVPALGGALAFMSGHCFVELVFSNSYFLPMAFGVFALITLTCGEEIPLPAPVGGKKVRTGIVLGVGVLTVVYAVLLACNMWAVKIYSEISSSDDPAADLQLSIKLDRFEWADPMLSYVYSARTVNNPTIRSQADAYAQRLAQVDRKSTRLNSSHM